MLMTFLSFSPFLHLCYRYLIQHTLKVGDTPTDVSETVCSQVLLRLGWREILRRMLGKGSRGCTRLGTDHEVYVG